ncbi:MAG: thiamine phosphate synthase [Breznakibacter sp.]
MFKKFTPSRFRLMYVTQGKTITSVRQEIRQVLEGGCRWVQIRMKDASLEEVETVVQWALPLCKANGAILIVNDFPLVARDTGAHGVHLGKDDMSIPDVRNMYPQVGIIGGTANTIGDIVHLHDAGADYAGIGPFRFTATKKRLSPILGLDGYRQLVAGMRQRNICLPFVAIGGIMLEDIVAIRQLGAAGIAVSGLIAHAGDPVTQTRRVIAALTVPLPEQVRS